jgi:hypothetical protein
MFPQWQNLSFSLVPRLALLLLFVLPIHRHGLARSNVSESACHISEQINQLISETPTLVPELAVALQEPLTHLLLAT